MTEADIQIPREILDKIAFDLVQIGSRYFTHALHLERNGFVSFNAFLEEELSLCSADEQELHKRCLVEEAKELLGSWGMCPAVFWGSGHGYRSPLLSDIRAARDAAGYDRAFFKTAGLEAWRCYLCPCRIKRERMRLTDDVRDQNLKDIRHRVFASYRAQELNNVRRGRGLEADSNRAAITADPRKLCSTLLTAMLGELGFIYSSKLSTRAWTVFVRKVTGPWQIRVGLTLTKIRLELDWFFCHEMLPKKPLSLLGLLYDESLHVEIRLRYAAPYFQAAYRLFDTLAEMELNLRAWVELYKSEHECIIDLFETYGRQLS